MTTEDEDGREGPTVEGVAIDLRRLQAQTDDRIQAINARFATVDRRFTSLLRQVGEIEQLVRSNLEHLDVRVRSLQGRLDATDTRIEVTRDRIVQLVHDIVGERRRRHRELIVLCVAASGWLTAMTIWVTT